VKYIHSFRNTYILCGDDEDQEIVKAASGALSMLTLQSKKICAKFLKVSQSNLVFGCC